MGESAASLSIDEICDAFERAWQSGTAPAIETVLQDYPAVDRLRLAAELIGIEAFRRAKRGDPVHADDYRLRFPDLTNRLPELLSDAVQIAEHGKIGAATEPTYIGVSEQPTVSHGAATPMAANLSQPQSGQLLGPYRLVKQLGAGGMGTVWEAVHTHLEKTVALKLLAPQLMSDPALVSRFEREMKAVGKLDHQHLVRAYDAGAENGVHYLAMEYVDGMDLAKYVRERGPLSVKQALHVMQQATEGLAEAHRAQLIHRDIKPANLMLNRKGIVKVMDLGLARLQGSGIAAQEGTLTAAGQILGTPDYMAPEQWDDTHTVDGRCDLYALGCTLFFLLTGSVPYRNQSSLMQKMRAHLTQPMPDLAMERQAAISRNPVQLSDRDASLPEPLVSIYCRLMEKDPEQRFASADELLEALRAVSPSAATASSQSTPVVTKPPFTILTNVDLHTPSLVRPSKSTLPWTGVMITVAVLVTVAFGIAVVSSWKQPEASSKPIAKKSTGEAATTATAVSWQGWPTDAPKPAIAPFDAAQAKKHQEEWAAYLKVPVEYTNSIGMKFRLIPPGEFLMGSTEVEITVALHGVTLDEYQKAIRSEGPQHRVIITQPYYLGVYELTERQYLQVMRRPPEGHSLISTNDPHFRMQQQAEFPLSVVTWVEATEFCSRLCEHEQLPRSYVNSKLIRSQGYLLPTEAQWEQACRAGTQTPFWSGDGSQVWKSGWTGFNSEHHIHAVGELEANPYGMFDTTGNLFEWCQDRWSFDPYGEFRTTAAVDPVGPSQDTDLNERVRRGGSWNHWEFAASSAARWPGPMSYCDAHFGVRLALTVNAVRTLLVKQTVQQSIPDFAKERAVAEWVLSIGGHLQITDPQTGKRSSLSEGPLPAAQFVVTHIGIVGNPQICDPDLKRLEGLSNLTTLTLPMSTRLTDAGVSSLARISSLQVIDLSGINLTDKGIEPLSRLPTLISINIAGTQITNTCLEKFANQQRLNSLSIGGLPVTMDVLRKFADHRLLFLDIHQTQIRTGELAEIASIFPSLYNLDASHMSDPDTPIPEVFFDNLAKAGKLETLALSGLLEPAALDKLARSSTIVGLTFLSWNGTDADLQRLATMPKLKQIDLISTTVTADGAQKFHTVRPDVTIGGDFNLPGKSNPKNQ